MAKQRGTAKDGGKRTGDGESVSRVQSTAAVIAILVGDLHLSHRAPLVRSAEPDWYAAQARPLQQIAALADEHKCPVVYAGDVLHRWNEPAELVNWAIENLPMGYSVAGNHDLPGQNYATIKRSAYWTLCEAGILTNLAPGHSASRGNLLMVGFPWGTPLSNIAEGEGNQVRLAVIHDYCWWSNDTGGYACASEDTHVSEYQKVLDGFHVALIGDQHIGFLWGGTSMRIFNGGTVQRRTANEIDYKPRVGLLRADKTIEQHFLDCSDDVFLETDTGLLAAVESQEGIADLLEELKDVADHGLDFCTAVKAVIRDKRLSKGVTKILLEAMGES